MVKKTCLIALLVALSAPSFAIDLKRLGGAASSAAAAVTLSDSDVATMSRQYVESSDATFPLDQDGMDVYTERLNRLTQNHVNEDGLTLNFRVYYTEEQNAFACADGSVRIYAGLMDMLTDDELLGVIGHEIGHVKHGDTKQAMKQAYMTLAARGVLASTGNVAASLSEGQLGELGDALIQAQHSQKQEYAADDYGYDFLKRNGYDPKAMAAALRKIQALEDGSPGKINALFSSHPDSGKRAERLDAHR